MQYQEELPVPRVIVRVFRIHIGTCRGCQRRVQGRHPLQTSDALGAASAQLGAQAVAFAVVLNKQLGLSFGKIAQLSSRTFWVWAREFSPFGAASGDQRSTSLIRTSFCFSPRGTARLRFSDARREANACARTVVGTAVEQSGVMRPR
jgi:hypothetical protein